MNEQEIKELRAHAGKLVTEGKPLSLVFERFNPRYGEWNTWGINSFEVPNFSDGGEWRIAKPKKQPIDWSHPYFKGCATNYGELLTVVGNAYGTKRTIDGKIRHGRSLDELRLATPVDEHANWQPFFSTPENDAKLRELAKMVNVEVRYYTFNVYKPPFCTGILEESTGSLLPICNYRITGLQDGWTDNPEEEKS